MLFSQLKTGIYENSLHWQVRLQWNSPTEKWKVGLGLPKTKETIEVIVMREDSTQVARIFRSLSRRTKQRSLLGYTCTALKHVMVFSSPATGTALAVHPGCRAGLPYQSPPRVKIQQPSGSGCSPLDEHLWLESRSSSTSPFCVWNVSKKLELCCCNQVQSNPSLHLQFAVAIGCVFPTSDCQNREMGWLIPGTARCCFAF